MTKIEITNRHTGAKRVEMVHPNRAFEAVRHFTNMNQFARIV